MTWTRVVAPLLGGPEDNAMLRTAGSLAAPFGANLTGIYIATTTASIMSWMGDGMVNGMDMALGAMQKVVSDGECAARAALTSYDYERKTFEVSGSDDWEGLRVSARLSDVVVFNHQPTRSGSFLSDAFQQILMDERRPVLIAETPLSPEDLVAVAWDGGREASRAARRSLPWLKKAKQVLVLTAPGATPREFRPGRLIDYLADQGVKARLVPLAARGEAGPLLVEAVERLGVKMLVAGAFGHPRFQRFIFGGATQTLLEQKAGPALFLSH